MISKQVQAVVAGHICLDIIPDLSKVSSDSGAFFQPGKLIEVGAATLSTGGAVSNTGLAMVKMGVPTALMGKIGDDPFGAVIRLLLKERWGVEEGMVVVPGEITSYTVVLNPGNLDRMFLHAPAANNTFCADDIDLEVVSQSRLFHFGYPPLMRRIYENDGIELVKIFQRVKSLGVTTSLDLSLPDPNSPSGKADWMAILRSVLPYVDIFVPSLEEVLYMVDRKKYEKLLVEGDDDANIAVSASDLTELSDLLMSFGCKIVLIKCGVRGLYLRTASLESLKDLGKAKPASLVDWIKRELWHPSFHVDNFAGATGSGDSSIAGFLTAFLNGYTSIESVQLGCAAGAFNVTALDALSGLRSWSETVAAVRKGWQVNEFVVTEPGWKLQPGGWWCGSFRNSS